MEYGDLANFVKKRLCFLECPAGDAQQNDNPLRDAFYGFSECRTVSPSYLFTLRPLHNTGCKILRMAAGLAYLHEMGVVHGDIKPNNVLLDHNLQPLFCDFGISKLQECDVSSSGTRYAGSTRHMCPERLLQGTPRTFFGDIYAFGITIFEVSFLRSAMYTLVGHTDKDTS